MIFLVGCTVTQPKKLHRRLRKQRLLFRLVIRNNLREERQKNRKTRQYRKYTDYGEESQSTAESQTVATVRQNRRKIKRLKLLQLKNKGRATKADNHAG